MKFVIFLLTLCSLGVSATAHAQSEKQKQINKVVNKVGERLMNGDITALDDLKTLPADDSVAVLIMYFQTYYFAPSGQAGAKEIAAKAAQYITEAPTAADYIKRLFKKEEGRPKSGLLMRYRESTLASLTVAQNPFAIGLLFELMDEPNLDVPVGDFSVALAKMNLPSAPFTKDARKGASTPEGIAKWKEWRKEHRTDPPKN